MTNLVPTPGWDNVPQLETTTVAKGGPGGPMNLQAQALINRTQYLRDADVIDFNADQVIGSDADALPVLFGVIHTGQSLAEGGVGGDVATGVTTAELPFNALMLNGGPVGIQTAIISPPVQGVREGDRVTIASSMLRAVIDMSEMPLQILFTGQAWGGMAYADLKKGGSTGVYEKIVAQVAAVCAQRPGVPFKYMTCIHGEQDGLNNNTGYAANLAEWLSDFNTDIKAITGQTVDVTMLLCQTSSSTGYGFYGGINQVTFPTPPQQLAAHVSNPRTRLVGPKYHLAYYDHSHIKNKAQRIHGEYYAKVIRRLEAGQTWEPVRPTSFAFVGNSVVVNFVAPVAPLVFDTSLVNAATNMGFAYRDDAGRTITGVALTGPLQVTIALSGAPGANAVLGYAHNNGDSPGGGSVQTAGNGARGNLRDSDTTASLYPDTGFPLYNWGVHFRQSLN